MICGKGVRAVALRNVEKMAQKPYRISIFFLRGALPRTPLGQAPDPELQVALPETPSYACRQIRPPDVSTRKKVRSTGSTQPSSSSSTFAHPLHSRPSRRAFPLTSSGSARAAARRTGGSAARAPRRRGGAATGERRAGTRGREAAGKRLGLTSGPLPRRRPELRNYRDS